MRPFDQFNETPGGDPARATARSLAFPSIAAAVVNGQPRLFAAWQERARREANAQPASPAFGSLREPASHVLHVLSTEVGRGRPGAPSMPAATSIPAPAGFAERPQRPSGPQLQPVLSISGHDQPGSWCSCITKHGRSSATPSGSNFISGIERQMDVRAARIDPSTGQLAGPVGPGRAVPDQGQLISGGPHPNGARILCGQPWESVDVRRRHQGVFRGLSAPGILGGIRSSTVTPGNGRANPPRPSQSGPITATCSFRSTGSPGTWNDYTPITNPALSSCSFVALRNANPYFAEIAGVVAGSPQNFKPLNIQRAFVTYVENRTPQDRFFRLTIVPDADVQASFKQFEDQLTSDVQIFRYSSRTQSIWVEPNANLAARVRMNVQEISAPGRAGRDRRLSYVGHA